jgi:outer membrane protein OmpA-like peptidoglycan-associated protein
MGCLAQDDAEGCKDSPLITRMPGSKLDSCDHKEFDELEIPVGKTAAGEPEQKKLDGELWTWSYSTREGTSAVQVYRNMAAALRKAGFYVVYEQPNDYLTAHKGNTWIYLNTGAATYYEQKVLQEKQMQQEVTADASSLADEINKTGHVAVYGIHFETAKATIEPDSEETLNQIVKLLQENPDLKLSVQGHTDNVGSKAANQALSEKRAQSVVAWLTGHGVTANRLSAKGLGDTQPVSDNSTEDGRARNRRVELVKQ